MSSTTASQTTSSSSTNSVLGPLTTTWAYPSSCAVNVRNCETCLYALQAQTCTENGGREYMGYTGCWPPRSGSSIPEPTSGWGVYSPGLICPSGFQSACGATGTAVTGDDFSFRFALSAAETAIGCCPSGYTCDEGTYQTCVRQASTGSIPVVTCSSGTSNGFSYMALPTTITAEVATNSNTTIDMSTIFLYAPLFQLVYQATDVASSTVAATTTASQTAITTTTAPSTASSGLSAGAKAGIAVGVVVGVLAILGGAAFAFWSQRKRKAAAAAAAAPVEVAGDSMAGGSGGGGGGSDLYGVYGNGGWKESPGATYEMPASPSPAVEMSAEPLQPLQSPQSTPSPHPTQPALSTPSAQSTPSPQPGPSTLAAQPPLVPSQTRFELG